MKNYYQSLGLNKSATEEVILAAYKALIRKYDPLNNPSVSAERAGDVAEIIEAYSVLSDKKARDLHDKKLSDMRQSLKLEKMNTKQSRLRIRK